MLKKVFSNTLIYTIGPQIPKIASLLILPILTKYLTATDYGIYGVILAYAGALSAFSDLGFAVVMSNAFFKYPTRWPIVWRQMHGYLSVWALFFGLVQASLLWIIIPKEAEDCKYLIILLNVCPVMFFNVTQVVGSRFFQYSQKPLYSSTVNALVGITALLMNLYTIAYLKMGYLGWFVSSFTGSFVAFLLYIYPVYIKNRLTPIFKIRIRFIKKQLQVSLPTIPHFYSSYLLNSSDRMVMDWLKVPINKLGGYNIAYTLGSYFDFFAGALGMAVGPMYTQQYAQKNDAALKRVRALTFLLQVLFIFGTFNLGLWAREIFQVLVKNKELQLAYPMGILILMGYSYKPMYWGVVSRLGFHEKTAQLWKISFIAGSFNVLLNLFLIPKFGVAAAPVTTFVALMYMGFAGYWLPVYKTIKDYDYYPIRWLIGIIVASVLVYILRDIAIPYKIGISAVLLAAIVLPVVKLVKEVNRV